LPSRNRGAAKNDAGKLVLDEAADAQPDGTKDYDSGGTQAGRVTPKVLQMPAAVV